MKYNSNSEISYYTIGFYNLENLFDIYDDTNVLDDDFTEASPRNWNKERYNNKIRKLGKIIKKLGSENKSHPPVIVGVAEVENEDVLHDLTNSKHLKTLGYNFIHFDSPDERGIDTALLYRENHFTVLDSEAIPLYIVNTNGQRDYTRDILYVKGKIENNEIYLLVNHWPSRRSGNHETVYKRKAAAVKNREIINNILTKEPEAKIIVMGDFNDNPSSESIDILKETDFYNPMDLLLTNERGTLNYKGEWNLFDQIIISNNFLKPYDNPFQFVKSNIFNPKELQEITGKYKGNPFRTFIGEKFLGGISDHFPVYEVFSVKK
jgi:predicted extracellular nuclease